MIPSGEKPGRRGRSKIMADQSGVLQPVANSDETENSSAVHNPDSGVKRRLSFTSERDISSGKEPSATSSMLSLQTDLDDSNSCVPLTETDEESRTETMEICLKSENAVDFKGLSLKEHSGINSLDKENPPEAANGIQGELACFPVFSAKFNVAFIEFIIIVILSSHPRAKGCHIFSLAKV